MILYSDIEQGSLEWLTLRLGKPTASEFDKIVTPTGKLSAQAKKYAFRLIAEVLLNRPMQSLENLEWVEHGKASESDAVKLYEFEQGVETLKVGFITTDDGRVGASPDRILIGQNGALECKCPSPQVHVGYMVDGFGDDYINQVQGQMYVGEFDFVDRYSFQAEMPPIKIRTYRDEDRIALLRESLDRFNDMKDEMLEKIRQQGFFAERDKVTTVAAQTYQQSIGEAA